jgi:two-component system osmolarity sensor histidine kinase EnvZ
VRAFDSLFTRLLLLQVGVVIALTLVFGAFVYVERNVAVARLVAERWAPALRRAAGWPGAVDAAPPPQVMRSAARPPLALPVPRLTPRMAALDDELRRRGVPARELLVGRGAGGPVMWLQVATPDGGAPVWLGFADVALLPNLPRRLVLALLIAVLLVVGVSWVFTRRLTRPLEQLRVRMQAQQPGTPTPAGPRAAAVPEIVAIDAAYSELLARYDAHERERALLLAGVSHDLRGPLARIRLAADLLPDEPALAARRESIVRNTQVADRLIQSFLDHVRAGELALDQPADLAALARGAVMSCERPAAELSCDAPASLVLAHTHPVLIERLLANLLDNALQHGRPPVRLGVWRDGAAAWIEVADAGPGVPPARRDELLRAFARGDVSRGTPGTGLGLAIVARVVARMGGSLVFETVPGGHAVRIRLPAAPP